MMDWRETWGRQIKEERTLEVEVGGRREGGGKGGGEGEEEDGVGGEEVIWGQAVEEGTTANWAGSFFCRSRTSGAYSSTGLLKAVLFWAGV